MFFLTTPASKWTIQAGATACSGQLQCSNTRTRNKRIHAGVISCNERDPISTYWGCLIEHLVVNIRFMEIDARPPTLVGIPPHSQPREPRKTGPTSFGADHSLPGGPHRTNRYRAGVPSGHTQIQVLSARMPKKHKVARVHGANKKGCVPCRPKRIPLPSPACGGTSPI